MYIYNSESFFVPKKISMSIWGIMMILFWGHNDDICLMSTSNDIISALS